MFVFYLLLLLSIIFPTIVESVRTNSNDRQQRRQISSSSTLEFTASVDYNKLYQRSLNINNARLISIEPNNKLWFSIENGTLYALPLFGDYSGPFLIQFQQINNQSHSEVVNLIELKLNFNFTTSQTLFHPSSHLLLALFNISSTYYNNSLLNRYYIVRTLSLALNLSETLLTIHKINGSMIKVYFSCDLYLKTDISQQLNTLLDRYYSKRLQLLPYFSLPLIEISIVRLAKENTTTITTTATSTTSNLTTMITPTASTTEATTTTTTSTTTTTTTPTTTTTTTTTVSTISLPIIELKAGQATIPPRLLKDKSIKPNRTVTSTNNLILLKEFYQPVVIIPLAIIAIGLFVCAIIACCLCCHRRSSSSSTLLLPSGPSGSPNNKHLYKNYSYRKQKQQNEFYRKKSRNYDQRQFISKGIPVVFAEEIDENIEQTHTPLVMRIEKAPINTENEKNRPEKNSH